MSEGEGGENQDTNNNACLLHHKHEHLVISTLYVLAYIYILLLSTEVNLSILTSRMQQRPLLVYSMDNVRITLHIM